jgi:hypothetical protein
MSVRVTFGNGEVVPGKSFLLGALNLLLTMERYKEKSTPKDHLNLTSYKMNGRLLSE